MKYQDLLKEQYTQFLYTLYSYPQGYRFLVKNKLWSGFWKYSWASWFMVGVAIILGVSMIDPLMDVFRRTDTSDPLVAMSTMGSQLVNFVEKEVDFLTNGSMRYLMLILLEIIIFHVCRRTLEVLVDKKADSTMRAFIGAQVRMIKVAFFCYGMEMAFGFMVKGLFGMFDIFTFVVPVLLFLSKVFFMGFAVFDNYVEQFQFSIQESFRYSKEFIGVSIGVGLVLHLFFMVPLVGPLVAPFLAAVTVTIVMVELTTVHIHGKPVYVIKQKKQKLKQKKKTGRKEVELGEDYV
ncbi:MAG: hypothetical protein AAF242_11545 [Bacteroidota bacterium]